MILLKGFTLSTLIYDNLYKRSFGDIDILVDAANLKKFYHLLNEMGYEQYFGYDKESKKYITKNIIDFKYHVDFHEYQCLKAVDDFNIFVELKRATSAMGPAFPASLIPLREAPVQGRASFPDRPVIHIQGIAECFTFRAVYPDHSLIPDMAADCRPVSFQIGQGAVNHRRHKAPEAAGCRSHNPVNTCRSRVGLPAPGPGTVPLLPQAPDRPGYPARAAAPPCPWRVPARA
jgi:hypothetical protein